MVARESQQSPGVGFNLRDFASQPEALYGTAAQQATQDYALEPSFLRTITTPAIPWLSNNQEDGSGTGWKVMVSMNATIVKGGSNRTSTPQRKLSSVRKGEPETVSYETNQVVQITLKTYTQTALSVGSMREQSPTRSHDPTPSQNSQDPTVPSTQSGSKIPHPQSQPSFVP